MLTEKAKTLLTKLADALEDVDETQFSMRSWFAGSLPRTIVEVGACGTTACAAGWATVLVPECGLKLRAAGDYPGACLLKALPYHPESGQHGYPACMAAFDLPNESDVFFLFAPGEYGVDVEKKAVIERIRMFVETNGRRKWEEE